MNQMLDETSALEFTIDYNWDNLRIGNETQDLFVFFGKNFFCVFVINYMVMIPFWPFGRQQLTSHLIIFFNQKHLFILHSAEKHPEHSAVKAKKQESKIKTEEMHANDENEEHIENNTNANPNAVNTPKFVDSDYLSSEIERIRLNNIQSSPLQNNNRANLRTKPITPKAKDDKDNKDFNVVRAGKLYEERKKQRMEELEKVEREKRKFQSKPAPNFRAIHAAQEHKKSDRPMKVTIPTTPLAIKHDREIKQRWQKRVSSLSFFSFSNQNFVELMIIMFWPFFSVRNMKSRKSLNHSNLTMPMF